MKHCSLSSAKCLHKSQSRVGTARGVLDFFERDRWVEKWGVNGGPCRLLSLVDWGGISGPRVPLWGEYPVLSHTVCGEKIRRSLAEASAKNHEWEHVRTFKHKQDETWIGRQGTCLLNKYTVRIWKTSVRDNVYFSLTGRRKRVGERKHDHLFVCC